MALDLATDFISLPSLKELTNMNTEKSTRRMWSDSINFVARCLVIATGLVISSVCHGQVVSWGKASQFNILSLSGGIQISGDVAVDGDLGVASTCGLFQLSGDSIIMAGGNVYVYTRADFQNTSTGTSKKLQPLTNEALLNQARIDALSASSFAAQLGTSATFRASQGFTLGGTFGTLTKSTTISESIAGDYVFDIGAIELSGSSVLTIKDPSNSKIIIDVTGAFQLSGSSSIVLSGVKSGDVVFNVIGTGDLQVSGSASVYGSILAPERDVQISGNSYVQGKVIAGAIQISGNSEIVSPEY
jgi:hypothetical protein